MIEQNLPVLPIVIPIMCAPLAVLLNRPKFVWPVALAAAWSTFGVCCLILSRVLSDGVITYHLGNWEPPFGIEFRIDTLNAYILPLVSGIGAVVMTYAPRSLAAEVPTSRHGPLYATYLLCLTGLLGMTITGDVFNVFVFLEISSLSMYAMVSMGPDRRALMAAFRYLVMGTLGGTFYLIGIGLLYMMTGTLNMADLAERLPAVGGNRTVLAGFAFLSVGLSLKIALFPLHLWLPNAYAYAPSAVTSFLAATATKVSVYMVLRFLFTIIGISVLYERFLLGDILQALGLVGIFVASTVAIFQKNVKRMLAYSSIAQIGYIVLGISFASATGLVGSLVHVFNHALMKGGLFMVLGCIAFRTGTVDLDDMKGMGRRMPWTMMAFVLGGLGMIGVPLTVGFVSKWYLVLAAFEDGSVWIAVALLLSSLLAVIYIWRVVEVAYFQKPPEEDSERRDAPLSLLIPTWVMIGATLFFGIHTDLTVGVARRAAEFLLGGSS